MNGRIWALGVGILGAILGGPARLVAQDDKTADRPLATREELQSALQRSGGSELAVRIKSRLTEGDFR